MNNEEAGRRFALGLILKGCLISKFGENNSIKQLRSQAQIVLIVRCSLSIIHCFSDTGLRRKNNEK
jgi:hypothetical protein